MVRLMVVLLEFMLMAGTQFVFAQQQDSPITLDDSINFLRAALYSRTAPPGFDIPREELNWKISVLKLNLDTVILSFHPERGVDFHLQLTMCTLDKKTIWSDATLLGPNETADVFYRDNLKFRIFVSNSDLQRCGDSGMIWESEILTDGQVLYTSEERLLKQMSNWMASLARSHDSERSLDFLRVIVAKQRAALLEADRTGKYKLVANRIKLFDNMFPFSIFDHVKLETGDRQAVRDWLEATLGERKKLKVFEPDLAQNTSRDQALLTRFSQPDVR